MNQKDTSELLEEYIRQIQAGKPLEQILNEEGQQAEGLLPLLKAAIQARSMQQGKTIPLAAMNRSRAKFLTAAAQAREPKPKFAWFPRLRLSSAVALLAGMLVVIALLSTGQSTVQALPGDKLYPVKIAVEQARLSLAPDPATRLSLEETFDEERAEETQRLIQLGRNNELSFAGFVHHEEDEGWEAAGLRLVLSPEQEILVTGMNRMYVEVDGQATHNGIVVKNISVRLFNITGVVQSIEPDRWDVGGVNVRLTPQTTIQSKATPGSQVYVSAMRKENGDMVAVRISDSPELNAVYQPATPTQPTTPTDEISTPKAPVLLPEEISPTEPQKVSTPEVKPAEDPEYLSEPEPKEVESSSEEVKPAENSEEHQQESKPSESSDSSSETHDNGEHD